MEGPIIVAETPPKRDSAVQGPIVIAETPPEKDSAVQGPIAAMNDQVFPEALVQTFTKSGPSQGLVATLSLRNFFSFHSLEKAGENGSRHLGPPPPRPPSPFSPYSLYPFHLNNNTDCMALGIMVAIVVVERGRGREGGRGAILMVALVAQEDGAQPN